MWAPFIRCAAGYPLTATLRRAQTCALVDTESGGLKALCYDQTCALGVDATQARRFGHASDGQNHRCLTQRDLVLFR